MKKLLLYILAAITLLVSISQLDDDLGEDAIALVNRLETSGQSEAYLFLYGIYSQPSERPERLGKDIFEQYRKLDADDSYVISAYPDSKKLQLPKGEEFCKTWEDGCIKALFSPDIQIESLLNEHEVLLSRSSVFFEFDEFKTLSKPTVHELIPPYQYLVAAERIRVLEAISLYRHGYSIKALDLLSLQLNKLRRAMELQDNLIGKLVFLMKLSEIIDVMSIIQSNEDVKPQMIPRLSQSEKSFHLIAAREFGLSYYAFKNLDRHPEFFEVGGDFPAWITRLLYKPNMTINALTPQFYELERLAQLSHLDFSKQLETSNSTLLSTSKIRNYVGSVLVSTASPEYDRFVANFYDLDVKLALFNQLHVLKLEHNVMKNPYYGLETPALNKGSLCFNGPLANERLLRCLRLQI